MNESKTRALRPWLLPLLLLLLGLVLGVALAMALGGDGADGAQGQSKTPGEMTLQQCYDAAVKDAVFAGENEIEPLVSLTKDDPLVTWNDAGDRVLLLTWHNYPDSYPHGETVTLDWGTVWVFTDRELAQRYDAEADIVTDWDLRLKQLVGFPPDSEHSTITGMWVRPEDVLRPAYQSDPTVGAMYTSFDDAVDEKFKAWFDGNIIWSYFDSAYPWTRLGYTYDWANNGAEYGLSEFLINQGAEVQVAFTQSTDEFLASLDAGGAMADSAA